MSDGIFANRSEPRRPGSRLAGFVPLAVFLVVGVFLAVGLTLNPRPADLTLHATPGVHTDGQLYLWVSDGFPGSVMPAFRKALSDEERWHLVNFIRTMAPK